MRFKVDENLPVEVVELLRASGHDAASMLDQKMGGEKDPSIADVCRNEGRILVTLDTDFANIQEYAPSEYPGIVVFRLGQQGKRHIVTVAKRWVSLLKSEELGRRLWVVDEIRVRIHG